MIEAPTLTLSPTQLVQGRKLPDISGASDGGRRIPLGPPPLGQHGAALPHVSPTPHLFEVIFVWYG
jgi:hypothetical protein